MKPIHLYVASVVSLSLGTALIWGVGAGLIAAGGLLLFDLYFERAVR